ncbi:MAG: alkaline phosphatase family protein [bacterium]
MRMFLVVLLVVGIGFASDGASIKPKVLVLGIDGMDPKIVRGLMAEGRLPNLRRLAERGTFCEMETSIPPQSPVAWSSFITGMNPGGHGIFDFIAREPDKYLPYLSTTVTKEPRHKIKIGKWRIPISKGDVKLVREGKAFWEVLEDKGVPCVVLRLPSNFPPVGKKTRSISGMGTPDILGTYGTFTFFTTRPYLISSDTGGNIEIVQVFDNKVESKIIGPANSFIEGSPNVEMPITIFVDPDYPVVKIVVDRSEVVLNESEWSDWVRLNFRLMPFASVHGIVRFYLKSVRPDFELYMSPVQIDPEYAALPISTPPGYSRELARAIGLFYTQGIAEETWALNEGRIGEKQYLEQTEFVLEQTKKMLDYELDRFKWGMLCCYISTLDPLQHMFWRFRDPRHPMYDPELASQYGETIEHYYVRMDSLVGHVQSRVGDDATIIVLSDHGFTSYRRNFHLNTWLYKNGYMALRDRFRQESDEFFENVDWSRTKAYALGINALYINQIGREGQGIVPPGAEKKQLVDEIAERLLEVTDPETGEQVIAVVYKTDECYSGACVGQVPDMIIGYNEGYRGSWETALGKVTRTLLTDNAKPWSGDHCMAKEVIPATLITNKPIVKKNPALYDLAPTILAEFGVARLPEMVGRDLFREEVSLR